MQTEAVWRALPRKIREVLAEKDLHDLQEIRLKRGCAFPWRICVKPFRF